MKMCDDNETCIHHDLFCDGYLHCPDGSDENTEICSTCPRGFGYPPGKLNLATVSCTHRYTGKKICTVPCDDDESHLCLEDFEAICQPAKIHITILFGVAFLILTVLLGELSLKFLEKRNVYEEISDYNFVLYSLITEASESTRKLKMAFSKFKHLHDSQDYCKCTQAFSKILLAQNRTKMAEMMNTLMQLELSFHYGDEDEISFCCKANHTKLLRFYKKPSFLSTIKLKISAIPGFIFFRFCTLLAQRLFTYYADMFKDLYIVIEYAKIFPWSEHDFSTLGYQVFILLVISITLPSLLNLAFVAFSKIYKFSKMSILAFFPFCPIIPALTIYSSLKYELLFLKKIELLKKDVTCLSIESYKKMEDFEKSCQKWTTLNVDLRSNENATEHIIQIIVVILLVAIKFSHSPSTSINLEELFVGNQINLLVLSALWSVLSLIRGHLQSFLVKRKVVPSTTGQLVLFCFILVAISVRIFAIALFFAPTLGLFDLLMHWKIGQQKVASPFLNFDVFENGTIISFGITWIQMKNYDELTGLTLETYYHIFLALVFCHFIVICIVQATFSRKFLSRANLWQKGFHVLKQGT